MHIFIANGCLIYPERDAEYLRGCIISGNMKRIVATLQLSIQPEQETLFSRCRSMLSTGSIWNRFDTSDTIQHDQIGTQDTSAVFNFDGKAADTLLYGEIYRWIVYADKDVQ